MDRRSQAPGPLPRRSRSLTLERLWDGVDELLSSSHLFRTLGPEERHELVDRASVQVFKAGTVLLREGDPGDSFFLIDQGVVEVSTRGPQGEISLSTLQRSAFFGEVSVLTGAARTATVTALTDVCVVRFEKPDIDAVLSHDPNVRRLLQAVVEGRARNAAEKVARASIAPPPEGLEPPGGRVAVPQAMSFNVTLHPFDEDEYMDLVLAVVVGRRPAVDLLARYATDAEAERLVTAWVPKMQRALEFLRAGDGLPWSTVVNFATAAMNAHVHPAYYLRDLGLSYWHSPDEPLFRPWTRSMAILAARVPEVSGAACDIREGFAGPCSAGSYIAAGDVPVVLREVERRARDLARWLAALSYDPAEALHVVLEVLYYAAGRNLAVLEVTDCARPFHHQSLFPLVNLRARHLGNLDEVLGRRVRRLLER